MGSPVSALSALVQALRVLPGVGQKSASRMALHLLQHERQAALHLAHALLHAVQNVGHCMQCHTLCETEVCEICSNSLRDPHKLCVVETSSDLEAIERTQTYKGMYFVLQGALSPLDGIGPEDIGLQPLLASLKLRQAQANSCVQELILATNFTAPGELTAHAIALHCEANYPHMQVSRLAQGVPAGSELEYLDASTLAHAFRDRNAAIS